MLESSAFLKEFESYLNSPMPGILEKRRKAGLRLKALLEKDKARLRSLVDAIRASKRDPEEVVRLTREAFDESGAIQELLERELANASGKGSLLVDMGDKVHAYNYHFKLMTKF